MKIIVQDIICQSAEKLHKTIQGRRYQEWQKHNIKTWPANCSSPLTSPLGRNLAKKQTELRSITSLVDHQSTVAVDWVNVKGNILLLNDPNLDWLLPYFEVEAEHYK